MTLATALAAVLALFAWRAVATAPADLFAIAYFSSAIVLLGLYDVWLPRGDAVEMTGGVAFAAGVFLSPLVATATVVGARLVSLVVRHGRESALRLVADLSRRVLSLAVGMLTLVGVRVALSSLAGEMPVFGDPRTREYVALAVAAAVFFAVDFLALQVSSSARLHSPLIPLIRGTMRLMGWMLAAHISVAVLTVLLYGVMQVLGLLISVALLLVMRQSFSLLIKTKETYRATVEVLAQAIEAHDPLRRGHAERVASLVNQAAQGIGIHGKALESLMYGALFHDVGRLGEDSSLGDAGAPRGSAEVLSDVGFFSDVLPVLRILDSWGNLEESQREEDIVSAYLIARMSAFDDARTRTPSAGAEARWTKIGTRLYAERRDDVDRVVTKVQEKARRQPGIFVPAAIEDV